MKKSIVTLIAVIASLTLAMPVYAGSWKQDDKGWWYQKDDGQYSHDCWRWIDGDGDGMAEWYYFDSDGYLLTNTTTPDGEQVDGNGAKVGWDGKVAQKATATLVNYETTLTMKNGVPYYKEEVSTWNPTSQNAETDTGMQAEDFTDEELAVKIVEAINEKREQQGKAPMEINEELMENATLRAEEATEEFSHTRPDGTDYSTAITVSYESCSENLISIPFASNYYKDVDEIARVIVENWTGLHRANFLQSKWEETGVGISRSKDANGFDGFEISQLFIKIE